MNSFGEIKSNVSFTQWRQWADNDGIDPRVAKELHEQQLPKAVEQVIDEQKIFKGDPRLKAIAVTLGPGLEKSLNVGIQYAQVRLTLNVK